jgi:hypothetical protein
LKFKATDRDDDTVTGHLKINVDDESPKITEGSGSISLHTDETLGGGADVPPNPGTTAENDEAGAVIPGVISAQVAGTVIGFSQGNAAGLFNAQYGADGPGSTDWTLTIAGGRRHRPDRHRDQHRHHAGGGLNGVGTRQGGWRRSRVRLLDRRAAAT